MKLSLKNRFVKDGGFFLFFYDKVLLILKLAGNLAQETKKGRYSQSYKSLIL